MKNSLMDLNNHLFAQIERLGDESMSNEALVAEVQRSKAVADIASKIIDGASLALQAEKLRAEYGSRQFDTPKMIGGRDA